MAHAWMLWMVSGCFLVTKADLDDLDRDGAPACDGAPWCDCDDDNDERHPGARDTPYNGYDEDCGQDDDFDQDRDGHAKLAGTGGASSPTDGVPGTGTLPADDCDDDNAAVYPGQPEVYYDGIDADCDLRNDYDADFDGHVAIAFADFDTSGLPADDCDDTDPFAHAGASETWYDGVDQGCNGGDDYDQDGDGWTISDRPDDYAGTLPDGDCDDTNPAANPGRVEEWYDGVDQDCDGNDNDQDVDGVPASGGDCDDTDPLVHPGLPEDCTTAVDDDCDGTIPACLPDDGVDAWTERDIYWWSASPDGALGGALRSARIDADDREDLVVAATTALTADGAVGAVFVLCGDEVLVPHAPAPLTDAVVYGVSDEGRFGWAVSTGDFNDDRRADLAVSAPYEPAGATEGAGAVYLLPGWLERTYYNASELAFVVIRGQEEAQYLGRSVARGDVDDDGTADLLLTARTEEADGGVANDPGEAWVVYDVGALTGEHALGPAPTVSAWTHIAGAGRDHGVTDAFAADVNGDGASDLLVSSSSLPGAAAPGRFHVFLNPGARLASELDTGDSDVRVVGVANGDGFPGARVVEELDEKGDGYLDFVFGAPLADPAGAGSPAGGVYVVRSLGAVLPAGGSLDLADTDYTVLSGAAAGDQLGASLSLGDANADGVWDLLVGAPGAGDVDQGAAWLVLGTLPEKGSWSIADVGSSIVGGVNADGTGEAVGSSVAFLNMDNDDFDDLALSAVGSDRASPGAGMLYLYFGGILPLE